VEHEARASESMSAAAPAAAAGGVTVRQAAWRALAAAASRSNAPPPPAQHPARAVAPRHSTRAGHGGPEEPWLERTGTATVPVPVAVPGCDGETPGNAVNVMGSGRRHAGAGPGSDRTRAVRWAGGVRMAWRSLRVTVRGDRGGRVGLGWLSRTGVARKLHWQGCPSELGANGSSAA
jgi:hypothetical protein